MLLCECLFRLSAPAASVEFNPETRRLFVGLDNGTISVSINLIETQIFSKDMTFLLD